MKIDSITMKGRAGWRLDNGKLQLVTLKGGGHIAGVSLKGKKAINPLWSPTWKTIEPWQYKKDMAKKYGVKLLSCITGHNICLGWFGDVSDDEAKAGMGPHGEAPVARWKLIGRKTSSKTLSFEYGCDLPAAQMKIARRIRMSANANVINITEKVTSTSARDLPYTMCQHVTVGPPFLEKGVTVFDMPATVGRTFPGAFSDRQRLKANTAFKWPNGPAARGGNIDLRTISKRDRASSDFSTQLIGPSVKDAWFSAVNPKKGVMLAYVWNRADFPWVGNWEENYGRRMSPWNGKSLTRGMEFANTPFPVSLREAVDMDKFQGEKTYRWLPAKGSFTIDYSIVMLPVASDVKGVAHIRRSGERIEVDLKQ